jgi:hypothetical protein
MTQAIDLPYSNPSSQTKPTRDVQIARPITANRTIPIKTSSAQDAVCWQEAYAFEESLLSNNRTEGIA